MGKMLEVTNFHYYYGEIHAIKGVSLEVNRGEIVTLIGANGAGKTTILRAVSGLLDNRKHGEIIFEGRTLNRIQPHKVTELGLSQVLEGRHIFSQLTVKENLLMGAYRSKGNSTKEDLKNIFGLFPKLEERQKQLGGTLSGGEQQMLAVGRVLMAKPKLLMMDEPSLGLAPLIVKEIFDIIKKIRQTGITVLLVEQNSNAALNIADRGYVIETGEIILTDKASNLLLNEEVKKSYLGY
jgi:branched-chain amino acid transport system ATP-binding protein